MIKDKMIVGFLVGVVGITVTKAVSKCIIRNMNNENENVQIGVDLAVHAIAGLAIGALMNVLDKDETVEIEE